MSSVAQTSDGLLSSAEIPSMLFSPRLKASMDLYEEILTEEVRSKDSSFEEVTRPISLRHRTIREERVGLGD